MGEWSTPFSCMIDAAKTRVQSMDSCACAAIVRLASDLVLDASSLSTDAPSVVSIDD